MAPSARTLTAGAAVAAAAFSCTGPALAANQTVIIPHLEFEPAQVAVKPGETVTWDNQDDHEEHNIRFDDGSFTTAPAIGPWTTSRTFPAAQPEGAYRYYCEIHGGPGGQGMAGVVYVNAAGTIPAAAPAASFTVSPDVATLGQTVSFNGAASADSDGTIVKYEWDLDGDGSYETNTGATPTTSRSYLSTGSLEIRLRVTDSQSLTHSTARTLRVTAAPTAAFTATPGSVLAGESVAFDGSGSHDPDGTVVDYAWDLDGNGSFETETGATPTASRVYLSVGVVAVRLRVTDNDGATTDTTRQIQVGRRPGAKPPAAPTPGAVPPPRASFRRSKRTVTVTRGGRFRYRFAATPGVTGTIRFTSAGKVSTSARRRLSLGTRRFTVPGSGRVTVRMRLSRRNLRILERQARIRFRVKVTLRSSAGLARSSSASLTLKKPRRG